MTWDISCQWVSHDQVKVDIGASQSGADATFQVGGLLSLADAGYESPIVARDLLSAAIGVYAADLRIPRAGTFDEWTRDMRLHLNVANPEHWDSASQILEGMLRFLTGDHWSVVVHESPLPAYPSPKKASQPWGLDVVSLFSGGLDSFVGAIDLLEAGRKAALVGHYSTGDTHTPQKSTFSILSREYPNLPKDFWFYVEPPQRLTGYTEPTTRSRSFLFLALGVLVASSVGPGVPLVVPENGLISLNVPLTGARLGSLSTRTTHPHYIGRFRDLLMALGLQNPVYNPYQFKTKGEMLSEAKSQRVLQLGAFKTVSCSHPGVGRWSGEGRGHCGYCVPCIIRRAALNAAGFTGECYGKDILQDPPPPHTKTGSDLRAFRMALARLEDKTPRNVLTDIIASGPLQGTQEDLEQYVGVYMRGMEEVRKFLYGER